MIDPSIKAEKSAVCGRNHDGNVEGMMIKHMTLSSASKKCLIALRSLGIPDKIMSAITITCKQCQLQLRSEDGFIDRLQKSTGVRQCRVLSPLLFAMITDWDPKQTIMNKNIDRVVLSLSDGVANEGHGDLDSRDSEMPSDCSALVYGGTSYREQATKPSYDLLTAVRTRMNHWLGHILRMPADRLVRRAVLALGQRSGPPYRPGSLLMDTPLPLHELVLRNADRRGWPRDSRSLSSLLESP